MSAPHPENRRRRLPPEPPPEDDSPAPGAVSHSVAPADGKPRPMGRLRRGARSVFRMVQLVLGVVIVVGASGGVAWGMREYVLTSPRFAIRTVAVEGTVRLSPEEVAKAGQVEVGDNIFALDLDVAKASIARHPWIAEASVTRRLPSSVDVAIVEHEAAALVSLDRSLYLATRDGEIFKERGDGDPIDLPTVTGIEPARAASDRDGVQLSVKRALDIAEELDTAGISQHYPLQEIHLKKDGSSAVTVGRDAIAIHLGQPPYKGKIEQAKRVLYEVRRRKAKPSVVFLDNDANPDRVVVRLR